MLSPAGIGFTRASCTAYSTMNGLMKASVSTGSTQRAASVTCSPQVSVPSGAAAAGPARAASSRTSTVTTVSRRGQGLMGPPGGGWVCGVTGRRCGSGAARRRVQVDGGHLEAQRLQHAVGQLVVAAEALAQARAPRDEAAVGVQLEGGLAAVQRRGDVVAGQLQQRRALQRRVPAAAERLLESGRHLGSRQVLVRRRDHERRAGQDAQDLGHALPRLLHGDAARGHVGAAGNAGAVRGEFGIELGRRLAAPHRLHVDDQVHQVLDRRLVLPQAHRVDARQREPQRELGLGQPGVELVPEAATRRSARATPR